MKSYLQKHENIKYSDHWSTPMEIYKKYVFDLNYHDPCPLYANDVLFEIPINKNLFVNPPYSDIKYWIELCINHHIRYGKHIVLLIPVRTDTKYFHKLLEYGVDLEFIKGRLKFGNSKNGAPFPSVLVHINKKKVTNEKMCVSIKLDFKKKEKKNAI